MKREYYYLLAGVVIVLIIMKACTNDPLLKEKVDRLERMNDSIQKSIDSKNVKIDSLNQTLVITETKIDSLSKVKQKIKIKREYIKEEVAELSKNELDSIIKSKPKTEVVESIFGYPLALEELETSNLMIDKFKQAVNNLKTKDTLKSQIIDDMALQLKNTREQRDLFEKASKPKNGLYIYAVAPINANIQNVEAGLLYQIKNKMFVSVSAEYNQYTQKPDIKVGIGARLFK